MTSTDRLTADDFDCPACHDTGCIDCAHTDAPIPDAVLADIRDNHSKWTTQQLGQEEIKRMFYVVRLLLAENDRDKAALAAVVEMAAPGDEPENDWQAGGEAVCAELRTVLARHHVPQPA